MIEAAAATTVFILFLTLAAFAMVRAGGSAARRRAVAAEQQNRELWAGFNALQLQVGQWQDTAGPEMEALADSFASVRKLILQGRTPEEIEKIIKIGE